MAPAQVVEEFPDVMMMVFHPQPAFDQIRDSLCRPPLRPVAVGHGSLGQETDKAFFLLCGQARRSAGSRLGFQRLFAALLERIAPPKDAARVTIHASGNLMKGQFLLEECNDTSPTIFQRLRRTVRSWHGDTPFQNASMILHYL